MLVAVWGVDGERGEEGEGDFERFEEEGDEDGCRGRVEIVDGLDVGLGVEEGNLGRAETSSASS